MEQYDDGEVNFGPLIDLHAEKMSPTASDIVMAKSCEPVATNTTHNAAMKPSIKFSTRQLQLLVLELKSKTVHWKIGSASCVNALTLTRRPETRLHIVVRRD